MKRREFIRTAVVSSGVMMLPGGKSTAQDKAGGKKPNILFIMTDQQFADAMSCAIGKKYINTPAMDSLAENGMRFTRAYAANPLCKPVRASIFSGLYPHQTGVQSNGKGDKKFDTRENQCLGLYFKKAGYETGYVGKWHMVYSRRDKEVHGFDFMAANIGTGGDDKMVAPSIEFIKKNRSAPFFLVVSLCNPHNICQWARGQKLPDGPIGGPPPLEKCPPAKENFPHPENETDIMALIRKSYHNSSRFPVGDFDTNKWRQYIWAYYRMTEKVDGLIAQILEALRGSGQEDETLVLFISDHGDCHGAHRFSQKTVFYDESTRVPFIVSYKGRTKKGTSDKLVQSGIDIIPTLFDFAGISVPDKFPGSSVRAIAEGKDPASWRKYLVVSNYAVQGGPVDGVVPRVKGRMVRSERYKYCIYSHGTRRESLVDMEKDPGEMRNVAGDPSFSKSLEQHRKYLKEYGKKYHDELAVAMLDPGYKPSPFKPGKKKKSRKKKKKK